ncbi:protein kinase domain protein [Ichthyophthirius multifiliis]|uniref:non-specific serine/threonine protein kinase n=1 Tax=Ichthyophthirius multifiliis TaxID=5932 RepID=G0R5T7_ICHMU|nr:protein kinase domain protein [Ichthyophthirius multifiliis]EGR27158.1 protein kinase domain protein [Ichthyophthirius multifiliis]|eukprot:XP_004024042.1 protein kinase domain protein [Ichthyophthirius multifiliis]
MTQLKDFEIINTLGEGSYSQVYKVKRKSDSQIYAMKKVQMNQLKQKEKQNALNEVRILASISNKHIINYKEAFIDEPSQLLCIIMEYAEFGDLQGMINTHIKNKTYFQEQQIWGIIVDLTKGLKALHDMNILHRDLKSANIFITKDKIYKLGDLNVSKVAKNGFVNTQTGTPYYASPEVWRDEPYNSKSDIWSLGCVLYEACAQRPPFTANDMEGLFNKIQKGRFDRIPFRLTSWNASKFKI